MAEKKYAEFLKNAKGSVEYWTQTAIVDFTEELARLMEEKNVNRAELANRIGSSQAYITKVMRGNVNFTLATMTKLARALGVTVRVHLSPEGVVVQWHDNHVGTGIRIVDIPPRIRVRATLCEAPPIAPSPKQGRKVQYGVMSHLG